MAFYVLSVMDWGMRISKCDSIVPNQPNETFASHVTQTKYVGNTDAGPLPVVTNRIGPYDENDTMISFFAVARLMVDDNNDKKNDSSYVRWTDLEYTENVITAIEMQSRRIQLPGLCDGGIGHQMNEDLGTFYRASIGVSGSDWVVTIQFGLIGVIFPLLVGLLLKQFNFLLRDGVDEDDGKKNETEGPRVYWTMRMFISLLSSLFFLFIGIYWLNNQWNDDRCGTIHGQQVASLGANGGTGKFTHQDMAYVAAWFLFTVSLFSLGDSMRHLMFDGNTKVDFFFNSIAYKVITVCLTVASFIMFIIVLGGLIGQNATDLCDPLLKDEGLFGVTLALVTIEAVICIFAILYGYSGAMPEMASQQGLSKSMSYFQLQPVAAITENFL